MNYVPILMTIVLLAGCSKPQVSTESQEAVQPETSRLQSLELNTGMSRTDVEKKVGILLGQENLYSPYANTLRGGIIQYRDGDWVLEVNYKAGTPAPRVKNPDGTMQHYPPIDETVLEYKIERIPNKPDPEQRTVRGVLRHFPSNVKSSEAWHGHNFIVGDTPVIATEKVPEEALKKFIGAEIIITGVWNPGEPWDPTDKEASMPKPLSPDAEVVVRGDGIKASTINPVEK